MVVSTDRAVRPLRARIVSPPKSRFSLLLLLLVFLLGIKGRTLFSSTFSFSFTTSCWRAFFPERRTHTISPFLLESMYGCTSTSITSRINKQNLLSLSYALLASFSLSLLVPSSSLDNEEAQGAIKYGGMTKVPFSSITSTAL